MLTISLACPLLTLADFTASSVSWTVDTDQQWQSDGHTSSGMTFEKGIIKASDESGQYSSMTKIFLKKMKPTKIKFKPSPIWDNWTNAGQVGPTDAKDAPIFLPVANDDYYFFGNSGKGYATWHSTDMINWTKYGHIHQGPNNEEKGVHFIIGRWITSAEYKDGKFYIIGDVPNDEDPHLWVDDNLKDDIPAKYYKKPIFNDPSHGSDSALFRSDEDGLFHIIYEDWSPIKASAHAWDSPLAGHTSSEDCINGFTHNKHTPVVDHRTKPTGKTATYDHPTAIMEYEIHDGPQDAFGDWSALKVGSQMYLFSDYDPANSHGSSDMKVAIHTSSSIYEKFNFIGTVGKGHPDPTSGFAEGQFYLITQQNDFTSPGPWVEEVQARVGVDIEDDGTIDHWTNWQAVKESYDHKPGYARVVDVMPAEIDLSSLPEGKSFKFELKIKDTTSNKSFPALDKVEIFFEDSNQ